MNIPDNIFLDYETKTLIEEVSKRHPQIEFPKWIGYFDGVDKETGEELSCLHLTGFNVGYFEWEYTDIEGDLYLESWIKEKKKKKK